MRQSIEYSMTANRAILDYASRYRERCSTTSTGWASDEIKWGSEDHWTFTPHEMARVQDGLVADGAIAADRDSGRRVDHGGGGGEVAAAAAAADAAADAATARSTPR